MNSIPKLTYYLGKGAGWHIRLAAFLGHVEIEDVRLRYTEYTELKNDESLIPLGHLPVLTVNNVNIVKTFSILKYITSIGDSGLYPNDLFEQLKCDSVLECIDELSTYMVKTIWMSDEEKVQIRCEYIGENGEACKIFRYLQTLINQSDGPFIGTNASIADLAIFGFFQWCNVLDGINIDDLFARFPILKECCDGFLAHPGVQDYPELLWTETVIDKS